jgi:hypothetical protein
MRLSPRSAAAVALLRPLAAASCSSSKKADAFPAQPIAAQLSDFQANTLAQRYLNEHSVAGPRTLITEEKQARGWWLRSQTPFDSTAHPPSLSYLIQVQNDGTVSELLH